MPAAVSVRTVQLWETDRNLPVRRLPRIRRHVVVQPSYSPCTTTLSKMAAFAEPLPCNWAPPATRSRVDCRRNGSLPCNSPHLFRTLKTAACLAECHSAAKLHPYPVKNFPRSSASETNRDACL